MSNPAELQVIYERVIARVDRAADAFHQVVTVVARRAETELKIAQLLRQDIPEKVDPTDALSVAMYEAMKTEAQEHADLGNALKTRLAQPAQPELATIRDKQKEITGRARRDLEITLRTVAKREACEKAVEDGKVKGLSAQKMERLSRDLREAQAAEGRIAQQAQSSSMPVLHKEFGEFDGRRLKRQKDAVVRFVAMYGMLAKRVSEAQGVLRSKLECFDSDDRSSRYVTRVFDAPTPMTEDDPEICAIALADYKTDDARDLAFVRGEKIKVLQQHSSGWWQGEIVANGNPVQGSFPRTFVTLGETDARTDQVGAVFLVMMDFQPVKGGDIPLLVGDLVFVDYVSRGRCAGTNLRTKVRGYFPLDNLETRTWTAVPTT